MKIKATGSVLVWIVYFILAFPMFYFVYKFGNPMLGANDFFDYYKLYKDWDIKSVDAPFNMRLLSSFFVYLMNKSGLHYETKIAFDSFELSKQVFFNAVFFNFLCVVSTCLIIFHTTKKYFDNSLLSFTAGMLYLLGFGTLFYEIMPLTDAFSILLFALIFHNYLSKSYWIIVFLILLILQREYVFMALGLIALLDYIKYRQRFYLYVVLFNITGFAIYYLLRKTVFYTATYDHQASPTYFLDSILKLKFPLLPYIKQTLMTINLLLLYFLVLVYKKVKKVEIDVFALIKILCLFIQINLISFAAVFGNNTGRYFYILTPLVIFYLISEIKVFFIPENGNQSR